MPIHVTRRDLVGAGAGGLLAWFAHGLPVAQMEPNAELFIFRAPSTGNRVIAVVAREGGLLARASGARCNLQIQAGREVWVLAKLQAEQAGAASEGRGDRIFAGAVAAQCGDADVRCDAVVLECARDVVCAGGRVPIWAELYADDGRHFRVGNPIVAALLAGDPALARAYRAAAPGGDSAAFTEAFAARIATIAKAGGGVADPEAHAKRVAARILPDVIYYQQDLPIGFNFAGQNGRHPADDTASMAATVLGGAVLPRDSRFRYQIEDCFPYFRQPGVTV